MLRVKEFAGCEAVHSGSCGFQIWDEAIFHKTNVEQVSDLFGILRPIPGSRCSLYPLGIGDNNPDAALFQDAARNPILSNGFLAASKQLRPSGRPAKRFKSGLNVLDRIMGPQAARGPGDDGRNQEYLM